MNPDKLQFKDNEYIKVDVEPRPSRFSVKAGNCLGNSYEVAKNMTGTNIVEGFLVTRFEDGSFESVGHVWNEKDGVYFDVTIKLIDHNRKIESNNYYLAAIYRVNEAQIQERFKPGSFIETEKHLFFKTNVKTIEKELKEYLNI